VRSICFSCYSLLLVLPSLLNAQSATSSVRKLPLAISTGHAPTSSQLPVTRVALYKNGVGFFEHSGQVSGNQSVTIDFTTAQLNDVLQTLTALDLNGGRISGAGYNSTTPLDQQLKSLPLALGEDPTDADLYSAIRGAHVEVTGSGATFTGRILNMETRTIPSPTPNAPATEKRFLTVISDSSAVRSLELTPATQVRLLDTSLHTDLNRYLELLASTRNQSLRHLTLQDNGAGARDLRVSYISEVPIWKSTYRILLTSGPAKASTTQTATLQGWSVVDNTTGSDWNNVQLSLIAGSPQSFIQPLSQPIYSRRPEIPVAQDAQLTPQTHESGEDAKVLKENGPPPVAGVAGMSGMGSGSGVAGGVMGGIGNASSRDINSNAFHGMSAAQSVAVAAAMPMIAYETAAADSLAPQTTTSAFDDYFEYKLTEPVTIRKNESALVPILQTKVDAEPVTLWSQQQPIALRALWIKNTSNLTLDRGSFSIVENGNFGGEGLLDPIHPNERRLLSYAADQAVRVTTESNRDTNRVISVTAAKGVLVMHRSEVAEITYVVRNAATDNRTVILEHPVRNGFHLDSDPKPEETTPAAYRFRVNAAPGETVHLQVGEKRGLSSTYQLTRSDDNQLNFILNQTDHNPQLVQALQPILDARRRVAEAQAAVDAVNQRLTTLRGEEERQRANIVALKDSDKSARQRFVNELNQSEDRIAAAQKDFIARDAELKAAQQDLANKIESLQINETLS
jgi:hypothetical protein